MIINLRGTGGAGKSTLARHIMAQYATCTPVFVEGRKRPIGYECHRVGEPSLWVVGHYETACGGADTITQPAEVYRLVQEAANRGYHVLFEGIIPGDDVVRTAALHLDGYALRVIALRVPMTECLASIQSRRDARGDARPLNPKNTVDRAQRLEGVMTRLRASGVAAEWLSRDEATIAVLTALGLP